MIELQIQENTTVCLRAEEMENYYQVKVLSVQTLKSDERMPIVAIPSRFAVGTATVTNNWTLRLGPGYREMLCYV